MGYQLIDHVKKHEQPITNAEKDVTEGIKKMDALLEAEKFRLKFSGLTPSTLPAL